MDLFVVTAYIRHHYSLSDSSQVVDPPSPMSGDSEMGQAAAKGGAALGKASELGHASGSVPREDASC